jgi:hypothetical protein
MARLHLDEYNLVVQINKASALVKLTGDLMSQAADYPREFESLKIAHAAAATCHNTLRGALAEYRWRPADDEKQGGNMYAIYDAITLELIEGGFFSKYWVGVAAEEYRREGRSVFVKKQRGKVA